MPNSQTTKNATRKPRKPSQTARILENVELLVALYEDQGSPSAAESSANFEPSKFEALIEKTLSKVVEEKTTALETKLTKKIDSLVDAKTASSDSSESFDALIELVSEQISSHTDSLAEKIEGVAELAVQANNDSDSQTDGEVKTILSDFQSVVIGFQEKLQSLEESIEFQSLNFETKTQEIQANVEQLIEKFESGVPAAETESADTDSSSDSPIVEDENSHWQKQKEAMLAKYGIDPEYRPLDEPAAEPDKESETVAELETAAAEKLEVLHQTINSISPEDKDAIEQLKRDLNSKLRDAEVEISINRARLSQERALLEQKQSELEQRTADLEAKLKAKEGELGDTSKKGGFMSRFTRHIGK